MHELITNPIVHAVILFAIAVFASKWLYKKDEKIEDRRRGAFKLAAEFRAKGMTWVPDLLEDYAVGDYDSIGVKLVKVGMLAHNDAALKSEFDTVFASLLKSKFQDPDAKAQLESLLEEAGHKLVPVTPPPSTPSILDQINSTVKAAVADAVAVSPIKPSGS
jgi:hypothetical protein